MSIFNKFKQKRFKEYVDIIEWINDTSDNLIWHFPCYKTEIKYGAELTVSNTQVAVLISNGELADVFQPGKYKLTVDNMPMLYNIKKWKQGYKAPFRADILFVNTKDYWNIRWASKEPVLMDHPQFGPIKVKASGIYSFRVHPNPVLFIRNFIDKNKKITAEGVSEQLEDFVAERFIDYLSISKINIVELSKSLKEFSSELTIALKIDFSYYGLVLTKFSIKNIMLPEWLFVN